MTRREPAREQSLPRGVRVYVLTVAVVAVGVVAACAVAVDFQIDWVAFGVLLALGVISVSVQEKDVGSKITFSFLSIILITSVVLVGPVGSALIGAVSVTIERAHRPLIARVFNGGMIALQGAIGGLVYLRIGGSTDLTRLDGPAALLMRVGLPLMVADAAQMLVNALLLSGIVRLSSGVPPRRFLVQIITNSGVAYLGYGVIGFLFLVLWLPADVGPFSAVLILAPLFAARWAFVQFGDEQRAHERTLNALVTAVETKDPYAAGHSGRVARLAEWMAEPLSIKAQDVEALKFAAMLHDVGKVGVPTRILRRPKTLSAADIAQLTAHPEHGVDLVQGIGFLSGSLDGIRHHHERWDGQGYPSGLTGAQIPLASRVIAVADAFDALTTARAERPAYTAQDAVRELESRRGGQFDPAVVAALTTVLERHPWPETEATPEELAAMRGYLDHDDPIAWEAVDLGRRASAEPAEPRLAPTSPPAALPSPSHIASHTASHTPAEDASATDAGTQREQVRS